MVLPENQAAEALPFLLLRDRWKTLRITVRPDASVVVKAPLRADKSYVLGAVLGKRDWIEAKRLFFRQRGLPPERTYQDGEIFHYLGRPFRLLLVPQDVLSSRIRRPQVRLRADRLEVCGTNLTPESVCAAIQAWRQGVTFRLVQKRLLRLHHQACRILGDDIPTPGLRVRSLKRRWGSCSSRGEITLACQLSAVPLAGVDYVILHELCHLRRLDHSPHFHALLCRLLPDAKQRARQLQAWGLNHARD